jgi:hypothetical protein
MQQLNYFRLTNYLYIQINAFSFEIGGFIGHISFRIVWIRIRFCIGGRWFRFCISFRFPLFLPYWQVHYFGYTFQGIELIKKKVYELQIFKFNY